MTLRFAAGKVLSRKRAGLTEKRLTKIWMIETQHQDRRLGLGDSIWDKWTRNNVNVKILIWVILLGRLHLSYKFWNSCPQKETATPTPQMEWRHRSTSGTKGKEPCYYYSLRSPIALEPAWKSFLPLKADSGTLFRIRLWQQNYSSSVKAEHLLHSKMSSANQFVIKREGMTTSKKKNITLNYVSLHL